MAMAVDLWKGRERTEGTKKRGAAARRGNNQKPPFPTNRAENAARQTAIKRFYGRKRSKRRLGKTLPKMQSSWKLHCGEGNHLSFSRCEVGAPVRENPFCDDNGACRGATSAAAVAARRTAPGDGPAFTKASAFAKAMADKPAGKHSCPHAPELITFPRGGKTDWGKKRRIFEVFF